MNVNREDIPMEIESFCNRCSQTLKSLNGYDPCIDFVKQEMSELLRNRGLFLRLMRSVIEGGSFPDVQRPTLFDNEIVLYIDPNRLYSLRIYLWGPGEYTPIHDHNAWGVIGAVNDGYEVVNYSRLDDESMESHAELKETERFFLKAAQCAHTFPLNEGIHRTGNPTSATNITLSLYGRPLARPFIQGFDDVHRRVYRILSPKRKKLYLASQAVKGLEADA